MTYHTEMIGKCSRSPKDEDDCLNDCVYVIVVLQIGLFGSSAFTLGCCAEHIFLLRERFGDYIIKEELYDPSKNYLGFTEKSYKEWKEKVGL